MPVPPEEQMIFVKKKLVVQDQMKEKTPKPVEQAKGETFAKMPSISSNESWNEEKKTHNLKHIDFLLGKTIEDPVL